MKPNYLAIFLVLTACSHDEPKRASVRPSASWESSSISVKLIGVNATETANSGLDQFYEIQFIGIPTPFRVPSHIHRSEVQESFARVSESFGGSSVSFSRNGKTVFIDDDSPGAASGYTHKFILAIFGDVPAVYIVQGPSRAGVLIEDWPRVLKVTDQNVTFQYDEEEKSFDMPISQLIQEAEQVAPYNPYQPF